MKTVTFDFKDGDKLELRDIHANDKTEEAVIKFNSFEAVEGPEFAGMYIL